MPQPNVLKEPGPPLRMRVRPTFRGLRGEGKTGLPFGVPFPMQKGTPNGQISGRATQRFRQGSKNSDSAAAAAFRKTSLQVLTTKRQLVAGTLSYKKKEQAKTLALSLTSLWRSETD
ncbi:hypothetical protein CDAR_87211 [Caerostris darwini]|uniref:Uncharacterized protein n=1 Tax=Caerostris darwini TaxID=1538125 RepID=A0AAV4U851_9ARAC|nr:hypothetical protein CDAR_87211 [Caerostris darwini]